MLAQKRPLALSIKSAAELSVSKSTIYRLIERGHLQRVKAGRRALITVQSLDAFCNGL